MSDTFFVLGPFLIRIGLRPDNPAFPVYRVFRGGHFIGKQFSRPCESDCRWLEREETAYATESRYFRIELSRGIYHPRRGQPTNAERERRAAEPITEE